ncbi:endoplasmic reticulum resident protein 44 [Bicyclus anynana]|uniref:Endoplasmic reticulum resident protein 44 n=1 Tax=Bicyclus anynana TaxID=110368 RepID=A0A6J1MWK6_BICAN|nr:endoplasmic reticulum resident protein 44 [Bicyclus anynana]
MENIQSTDEPTNIGVVEVTESNIDDVIASNDLVLMVFYRNWRTSDRDRILSIFDGVAKEITKAGLNNGKVALAKVDSDNEEAITTKYDLYVSNPRIVMFANGVQSREGWLCRCKQSVEGYVEFIRGKLSDPIIVINSLDELHDLNENIGHIVACINSKDQPEYDILRKVATSLREECRFYVMLDDSAQRTHLKGQLSVMIRSTGGTIVALDDTYSGSMLNFTDMYTWAVQAIFPLLQEINSENEENLSKKYPCIILLHIPSDTQTVKLYKEAIRREYSLEERFSVLLADGTQLEHLLVRFGKSVADLPLIAFEYYNEIRLYDYNILLEPGKLNKTTKDVTGYRFDQNYVYAGRLTSVDTKDEGISKLFE